MKSSIVDIPKEINISDKKHSLNELLETVNLMSSHPKSHIKLYKSKETKYTAIFSWQSRNKWKIDYPIELNKIHKQRYVTKQECLRLVEEIYKKADIGRLESFIDVPVKHFTLDEMLEFKREDEMMLRGEDPDLLKSTPTPKEKPKVSEVSKSNISKKKTTKSSIILGNIAVPKEQPRTKTAPRITGKKKPKTTSPLKEFKATAEQLQKEKELPKTTKTPVKPVAKKTHPPKPTPAKADNTSLLNLEESTKSKKEEITKAITVSKTSEKKTEPSQTIAKKSDTKTPEKKPLVKPRKSKGKTLHQLGAPIAEKKKVVSKKPKPVKGKATKKDTQKPSDEDNFFSI